MYREWKKIGFPKEYCIWIWKQQDQEVDQEIDGWMKWGKMEEWLEERSGRKKCMTGRNGRGSWERQGITAFCTCQWIDWLKSSYLNDINSCILSIFLSSNNNKKWLRHHTYCEWDRSQSSGSNCSQKLLSWAWQAKLLSTSEILIEGPTEQVLTFFFILRTEMNTVPSLCCFNHF